MRADETRVTLFQRQVYRAWLDTGLSPVSSQELAQEIDLRSETVRAAMMRCCERGWATTFWEPLPLRRAGRRLRLFELTRQGALQLHLCLERPRRGR